MELSLREPVWFLCEEEKVTEEAREDALKRCGLSELNPCEKDGKIYYKIHIDFLTKEEHILYRQYMLDTTGHPGLFWYEDHPTDKNKLLIPNFKCKYGHDESNCSCENKLMHIGQDEKLFYSNNVSGFGWIFNDRQQVQPKGPGDGLMVSGFIDSYRGYGCHVDNEELNSVNDVLKERGMTPIQQSPGHVVLKYGKNRDGYWTCDLFSQQVISLIHVYQHLYPNMQLLFEIDQSSCHLKKSEDGHHITNLNIGPGGRVMKDSPPLTEECLGPGRRYVNVGEKQVYQFTSNCPLLINLNNRGKKKKYNTKESLIGVGKGMLQILISMKGLK